MEIAVDEITIKPVLNNVPKKLLPKNKKKLPVTQEFDPISSINTVEIARSNDILQAALRPFTNFKYNTYQTK